MMLKDCGAAIFRLGAKPAIVLAAAFAFTPFPARAQQAEVRFVITNGGEDVAEAVRISLHAAGKHDGPEIASAHSGEAVNVPKGRYDVQILFESGAVRKEIWLDGQAFQGKAEKKLELGVKIAEVVYRVINQGEDVGQLGHIGLYAAGNHDGPEITFARPNELMRVAEGKYDARITFEDGSVQRALWQDGLDVHGKVEKTVELGVKIAEVVYHVTNQGEGVGQLGHIGLYAAGNHGGSEIAFARPNEPMRVVDGKYDALIKFDDGSVRREIWQDGVVVTGKVEKSVEISAKIASVVYRIVNQGEDVGQRGHIGLYAAGKHDGPEIAFARPNEFMRVPDGKYDVRIDFEAGLAKKSIWIDSQAFSGKVERKVELGVKLAEPRISATLAGKDVGDNVRIAVITSAEKVELGDIRGGESILMEAGTYDFEASVPGFEGLLRNATVAGKPHLIVPLEPLKTAELKAGGPPPRACIIEVYGVNFDTAKSDLRPDSDSVLKAVLKLFAETPEFQAEIGGHTDDVGKPEYNQKLSQARAAAVKAWLVRHGIGAERVSSRGYGEARPLVANDSDEHRFKNRRVELRRTDCR